MTDTDTDIETTRAIADDEMHASHHINSLEEINALWHCAILSRSSLTHFILS